MATRKTTRKGSSKGGGRRRTPVLDSGGRGGGGYDDEPPRRRKKKRKGLWARIKQKFSFDDASGIKAWLKKAALWGAVAGALVLGLIVITLPDIDDLNTLKKTPSVLMKAEDGDIVASVGDIYGEYIPFKAMPKSLVDAVIATEDRNFYHHFGVDPLGLARALVVNVQAGGVRQGGSTITQQVAKNVFLTPERSLLRKVREMVLAVMLEQRYTKEDILTIYLNRVYLGAGSFGVDAAARRYFDKSARELSLSESAVMAGLLKAPSRYAPSSNPAASRTRALVVLGAMQDAGYLTEAQANKAKNELNKTMSGRKRNTHSTQYFADWVMEQLPDLVGEIREDVEITVTLAPRMQAAADKAITEVMNAKDADALNASQAALVSMAPDGAVRAMVGGRDYAESQYNRAAQSLRQPGSAFKLFVFLAGLEDGLRPSSTVVDQPVSVKVAGGMWRPKNYTNKYLGEISMRAAVAQSVNTVAVQVAQQVGLNSVVHMAHRLGIGSDMDPLPSLALGATEVTLLDLTTAYAHLAAQGGKVDPYGILEIRTRKKGKVIYRHQNYIGAALSRDTVGMMNDMLMDVIQEGTGRGAQIGRDAAGKTGTTSDYRDAWFIGYTPDLVAGVWVGNDDNTPMKKVTGGMLPARIWRAYMQASLAGTEPHSLPTGGGWFSAAPELPWQGNEAPPPGELPEQESAPEDEKPAKVLELGPSFWNKLMR